MATNQGFKSFIPDENVHADYLYWWLKTNTRRLQSIGNGATFKEISKSVISQVKIPLPPLLEQKRIAAILDQADALRRQRQAALDRLNTLGQSIFYDMFGDPFKNPKAWAKMELGKICSVGSGKRVFAKEFKSEGIQFYLSLIHI